MSKTTFLNLLANPNHMTDEAILEEQQLVEAAKKSEAHVELHVEMDR